MNNCGMMRSFGRLGDRSSGDGGSMSMNISVVSVGRVGIGRNIFGMCLFGIPMSGQFMSLFVSAFTVIFTFLRLCWEQIKFHINSFGSPPNFCHSEKKTLTTACSMDNLSSSSLKLFENVVSLYEFVLTKPVNLCCRGMIGVKAGEGIGVGNSRMGDRHLFTFDDGTSNKMVGFGFSKLLLLLELVWLATVVLCAFNGSKTGTSIDTFGK